MKAQVSSMRYNCFRFSFLAQTALVITAPPPYHLPEYIIAYVMEPYSFFTIFFLATTQRSLRGTLRTFLTAIFFFLHNNWLMEMLRMSQTFSSDHTLLMSKPVEQEMEMLMSPL